MVWLGVFCNVIAGIFNAGYTVNSKQSAKMLKDLHNIKKNRYIDQGVGDVKQGSRDEKLNASYDDEDGITPYQRASNTTQRQINPSGIITKQGLTSDQEPKQDASDKYKDFYKDVF